VALRQTLRATPIRTGIPASAEKPIGPRIAPPPLNPTPDPTFDATPGIPAAMPRIPTGKIKTPPVLGRRKKAP
jgi:hypothetical protein